MKPIFNRSLADEHFARLREILHTHTPDASSEQLHEMRAYKRLFAGATLGSAAIAATAFLTHQSGGLASDLTQAMGLLADYVAPAAAAGWLGASAAAGVLARKMGYAGERHVGEAGDEVASLRSINETLYKAHRPERVSAIVGLAHKTLGQHADPDPMEVSLLMLEVERRMGPGAALELYAALPEKTTQNTFVRATTVGIEMRQSEDEGMAYAGPNVTKVPYAIAEGMTGKIAIMVFEESLETDTQDVATHLRFAASSPDDDGLWHARDIDIHKQGCNAHVNFGTRCFVFEDVPQYARREIQEGRAQVILVPPLSQLPSTTQSMLARLVDPNMHPI